MFNPTNCDPPSFSGTAGRPAGHEGAGANAPISSRFQVGSCRSLEVQADVQGLDLGEDLAQGRREPELEDLATQEGGLGTQANVQKVKVSLPKQLPAPLKTLQKACTAKTSRKTPPAARRLAGRPGEGHTPVCRAA